jgi:3-methylcrotonyl-CoA carboxylase alpha subunit
VEGQDTIVSGELEGDRLRFELAGHRQRGVLAATPEGFILYLPSGAVQFAELRPDIGEAGAGGAASGLTAPMNGTVVTLLVEAGSRVSADQPLLVMEAMKMEHTIRAPGEGLVEQFFFQPGDLVDGGAELLQFTPTEDS